MASRRGSKKTAGKSFASPAGRTDANDTDAATTETAKSDTAPAETDTAAATKDTDSGQSPAKAAAAKPKTSGDGAEAKTPETKTAPEASAKPATAKQSDATAEDKPKATTATAKAERPAKADDRSWGADTDSKITEPSAGPSAADAGDFDPYRDDDLGDGDLRDSAAHDDLAHSALDDPHHDDEHGRSLAGTALAVLVGVLFVAGLTLWAAPKLAPHLPAGVAKYLMPGEIQSAERLAALEEALTKQGTEADTKISALQAELAALAGRTEETASAEVAEAAKTAAEGAAADAAALATHLATVDQELAGLRSELTAMSSALSDAAEGAGAAPAELAANLAALGARLDKVATATEENLAAVTARLDAVESSAADAQTQQSAALGEVETALQSARLEAALDVLSSQVTNGLPYGAKLNEVAGMAGKTPPEALTAGAANGVANATELEASYSRFANAAVAADVRVQSGEGALGAFGWLKSQVAGRPVDEQTGDTVGAVTSRIGARVAEGDLTAALTEAGTLPEHAQAGLGRWLERLRARVAAEAALETWRADIGAGG